MPNISELGFGNLERFFTIISGKHEANEIYDNKTKTRV